MANLVWSRPRVSTHRPLAHAWPCFLGASLTRFVVVALLFSVPNAWFAPPDHYQIKADSMTLKYNIDDGPPFAGLDVGQILAFVYGPFLLFSPLALYHCLRTVEHALCRSHRNPYGCGWALAI